MLLVGELVLLPHLGSVGELALVARHWRASPYDMGMGELAQPLAQRDADAGELVLSLAWAEGELALVVWMREFWQADQFNYHPGPEPGL